MAKIAPKMSGGWMAKSIFKGLLTAIKNTITAQLIS